MVVEKLVINVFISSIICLVMYLVTAILFSYDGINLNEEGIGYMALMLYFIVPFITIRILELEHEL